MVRPPTPPGHWLWGNLPEVRRDMPQALRDVTAVHGGLTRLRMGPASMYLLAEPDLIHEVLVTRAAEFRKSNRTRQSIGWHLGDGLVTLEGAAHRRHRRIMQPSLHTQRVAAQADTIVALAEQRVASWPPGSEQDLLSEMADLTLRIVCAALFDLRPAEDERLIAAVHDFAASLNWATGRAFPLPRWLPSAGNRRAREIINTLNTQVYALIARRRATAAAGADLLSMLLAARDADTGAPLSDVEIRDELMTVFFAGHETSAAALTWALHLLDAHPDVMERLREELGDGPVTMADLPRLPLLLRVVKEVLRLYPPAWLFDRSPLTDLRLGGYDLPRGATLLVSPWVVHRDPRWWDAPDEFRPDRFADEPSRGHYFPFGDGPRLCVGNRFAETEIALVLATIVRRVALVRADAPAGRSMLLRPAGEATLRPGVRLRVTVTPVSEAGNGA
ncbi:cytochrome P450 [Luedemannella flava]|uniref:Cytochrome P450 n=1 Tax=Luedemannella flava TaxID=349316 RepID=A0ABN2MRM3_9ACTN